MWWALAGPTRLIWTSSQSFPRPSAPSFSVFTEIFWECLSGLSRIAGQFFGLFQFSFCVRGLSEGAIGLAEQLVRHGIARIHADGALQGANRQFRLTFL